MNTLILTGVNTNSCVLATATAANVRDYAVIVAEDCVDTMDGPELHDAALLCMLPLIVPTRRGRRHLTERPVPDCDEWGYASPHEIARVPVPPGMPPERDGASARCAHGRLTGEGAVGRTRRARSQG